MYYLYGDSTEVVDDNNVEESENEEFEYTLDLQRRLPCAAHMLQNVMKDALLKNLEGQEAFKALKSLITSFRKSDATGMLNKYASKNLLIDWIGRLQARRRP